MDEFDALLEEPFAEDVDWTAIEGMTSVPALPAAPQSDSEYFVGDDGLDEAFLDEVRRLEERAIAWTNGGAYGRSGTAPTAGHGRTSTQRLQRQQDPPTLTSSATGRSQSHYASTMGSISAPPAPHNTPMASRSPPPSWVQLDNDIHFFLDPPQNVASNVKSQFSAIKRMYDESPTQATPRKRRRCSGDSCDQASPSKRGKIQAREAKSEVLQTFERMLECSICYDTMAASHSLSCGHSACGVCLIRWLHGSDNKTSCFQCRARHKGALIPNFVVDAMAEAYFEERLKIAAEDKARHVVEDRMHWETRRAEGKAAAVQEKPKSSRKKRDVSLDFAFLDHEVVVVAPYR